MSMWFIMDSDQTLLPSLAPLTGDRGSVHCPPAAEWTLARMGLWGTSEGMRREKESRNREMDEEGRVSAKS